MGLAIMTGRLPHVEVSRRGEFVGYWADSMLEKERGRMLNRLARAFYERHAAVSRERGHPA
jgi:hypothetical protein